MATEEDDDDIEINPITMLQLDDYQTPEPCEKESPEMEANASNPHLQQIVIRSIGSTVVIRQIPSEGLSFQLWTAASTFVKLLDLHRNQPTSSPLAGTLAAGENRRRLRILELGAGTGLVGIAAAVTLGAKVTITDLSHVLPNLRFNADANSDLLAKQGGTVDVAPLCWGDKDQMEEIGREFDLIIGSDVVYHDHLYDPLIRTLQFLLYEKKVFLMAHLKRWKKESAFFKKARKLFDVEIIHTDDPCSGSRIGVVLYRFGGKRS